MTERTAREEEQAKHCLCAIAAEMPTSRYLFPFCQS